MDEKKARLEAFLIKPGGKMKDYISLGPVPADENCVQVGEKNYMERAINESKAYIHQLIRQFGGEPVGARLAVKSFPHDFGNYVEVICWYHTKHPAAVKYAFRCESEAWTNWDEEAKRELRNAEICPI